MRRLAYFIDSLRWSYTWRVIQPNGWQGVCRAHPGPECATRFGAWRWNARWAWRCAGEDIRRRKEIA